MSSLLGQELTLQETRGYLFIHGNGVEPISQEDLYFKLTGIPAKNRTLALEFNGVLVGRIRDKLGDDAILTIENEGYMSRRAWIENIDFKNPPEQKLSERVKKRQRVKWQQEKPFSRKKLFSIFHIKEARGDINIEGTFLSPREKEILEIIKTGKTSNKEIAIELSLVLQTVKNHLTNIYRKLEVFGKTGKDLNRNKALVKAILLKEIDPFKPSIDQEDTPIFQLGAFRFIIDTLIELYSEAE